MSMCDEAVVQKPQQLAVLLTTGRQDGQDALGEATARSRIRAITQLAPDHPMPKRSFGFVVGRLDVGVMGKRPQYLRMSQQATT